MDVLNQWDILFKPCIYSYKLLYKLENLNKKYNEQIDIDYIRKAIFFAKKFHGLQLRKSGEPYYSHPLEVASMVADHTRNTDLIIISILHDTLEDTQLTFKMIADHFSIYIAESVLDLTRIKNDIKYTAADIVISLWKQQKHALLMIKLFDRLHNIRTLGVKSPNAIEKTTIETVYIFISVAVFYGLREVEIELSTLCIEYYNAPTQPDHNNFIPYGNDKDLLLSSGLLH